MRSVLELKSKIDFVPEALMSFTRAFVVGLSMMTGVCTVCALLPLSSAVAAEEKVGAKVGKPLQEAQAAIQKKQWDTALSKIKEAQAVEKRTPFEDFKINQFLASVYVGQKKNAEAANTFESILNSGFLPAAQSDEYVKRIALLNFQAQRYPKLVEYAKRYLQNHPNDAEMQLFLGQGYYSQKDYKSALAATQASIALSEKNGKKPDENSLLLIYRSNYELKDEAGQEAALEKLVRYYPKTDYWKNLLSGLQHGQQTERLRFAVYRMMIEANVMDQPSQYLETAQLAMSIGLPGEAQKIMEKGYSSNVFGAKPAAAGSAAPGGGDQGRYQRTLDGSKKLALADKAALPKKDADARAASTGDADVALGASYLSFDQYDQAIEALDRGIKKGGLKEPEDAQINLGIAYLRKNEQDKARAAFKAVKGDSGWTQLAKLWLIRAGG
jgi:cytochrome c-type biogenesis protein CcmH/NrfG